MNYPQFHYHTCIESDMSKALQNLFLDNSILSIYHSLTISATYSHDLLIPTRAVIVTDILPSTIAVDSCITTIYIMLVLTIFMHREALANQRDNAPGRTRPSVCLSVIGAYTDNIMDVVDRLLISYWNMWLAQDLDWPTLDCQIMILLHYWLQVGGGGRCNCNIW